MRVGGLKGKDVEHIGKGNNGTGKVQWMWGSREQGTGESMRRNNTKDL